MLSLPKPPPGRTRLGLAAAGAGVRAASCWEETFACRRVPVIGLTTAATASGVDAAVDVDVDVVTRAVCFGGDADCSANGSSCLEADSCIFLSWSRMSSVVVGAVVFLLYIKSSSERRRSSLVTFMEAPADEPT